MLVVQCSSGSDSFFAAESVLGGLASRGCNLSSSSTFRPPNSFSTRAKSLAWARRSRTWARAVSSSVVRGDVGEALELLA